MRIRQSDFNRLLEESYTAATTPTPPPGAPSAEDFWGGEAVGLPEAPVAAEPASAATPDAGAELTGAAESTP